MSQSRLKLCTDCKVEKDLSEFSKNPNKKDGLNYRCKTCQRVYNKEYYLRTKQKHLDKVLSRTKSLKLSSSLIAQEHLSTGCVSCHEDDERSLVLVSNTVSTGTTPTSFSVSAYGTPSPMIANCTAYSSTQTLSIDFSAGTSGDYRSLVTNCIQKNTISPDSLSNSGVSMNKIEKEIKSSTVMCYNCFSKTL